jgi:type II secretory pathway pseudopilin PulG
VIQLKQKGFTLIELLAIIVILTVIATVVMPSVFTMIRKAKDNSYKVIMDSFEESAKLYVTRHRDTVENDLDLYNYYTLALSDLKSDGLLTKANLVDPRNNENIDLAKKIIVTREADMSLTICFEDRGCFIPTLLTNELTKEGNVVSETTEGLHYDATNDYYFYMGSNPKNWLEFDNYLWRIVKINVDGSIKLIYEGPKNKDIKDLTGTLASKTFADSNTNTFSSTTSLSTYLQNFYTSNIQATNTSKIQATKWCIGKTSYSTSGTAKSTFLSNECSAQTTDNINVGLLNASDYLYASLDTTCLTSYKTSGDNGNSCKNNNYLYKSNYNYWSINGDSTTTNVWIVNHLGSLGAPVAANTNAEVRPAINLIPSVLIAKGDGTHDNPYTIKDTVNVDREKPTITILGSNPVILTKGDLYSDAGATATDSVDGNLTSKIIVVSNVNTNIAGNYNVTYTVSDRSGNKRIAIRNVSVAEKDIANAPSLTTGLTPVKWNGANWVTTTSTDTVWYNYNTTDKKWANAINFDPSKTIDYAVKGHTGLISGTTQQADGIYFNGTSDFIRVDDTLKNYNFNQNITQVVRFKIHTLNSASNQCLFGNWENGGAGVYITPTNYIRYEIYINGAYKTVTSTTPIEANRYYTVAATYDGSTVQLYIDGQPNASLAITGTIGLSPATFGLGGNPSPTGTFSGFANTTISDAATYTSTLSAAEILANYSTNINMIKTNLLFGYKLTPIQNTAAGTPLALDNINSMWVWIPRYIYKISSGWHSNTAGTIDVKFSQGTDDTFGGTVPLVNTGSATDSNGTWTSHPAFTFGTKQLTGIWVAKFEASNLSSNVKIVPNVQSLRSITVNDIFTATRNTETNSIYGWGTSGSGIDTHMMANDEWGAVAYLSKSSYGLNGEIYKNNSSSYYTGRSGGNVGGGQVTVSGSEYIDTGFYTYDGKCASTTTLAPGINANCTAVGNTVSDTSLSFKASTTGNIYGIYDISGGSWEYTAAYINNGNVNLTTYGNSAYKSDDKYKNAYAVAATDTDANNYPLAVSSKGDAIYETSNAGTGTASWYGDYSYMTYVDSSWFTRGGPYDYTSNAGAFHFCRISGGASSRVGFRPILLVEASL